MKCLCFGSTASLLSSYCMSCQAFQVRLQGQHPLPRLVSPSLILASRPSEDLFARIDLGLVCRVSSPLNLQRLQSFWLSSRMVLFFPVCSDSHLSEALVCFIPVWPLASRPSEGFLWATLQSPRHQSYFQITPAVFLWVLGLNHPKAATTVVRASG